LLGYEPDEFPATYSEWLSLTHPEDHAKILQTTLPNQKKCFVELHQNFEYRMKHKSGEYRWYCHRAVIDHNESGVAVRMTGSVADIQERKQAELYAKEGIMQRDNFLSMLSHELRNPMGAVLNAIDSFESQHEEMPLPCPAELSVVRRQTKHMARLLDDLLDVARLGRGRIEFRKEVVDLCQLADAAIESTNYEIQSKQQTIRTTIPNGKVCVFGDPARLKQAQINLLVNASKFSEPGQEIHFAISTEDTEAVITIADDGAGIPEQAMDSIFDLFIQSEITLERSIGGMGVGLSLARSIVEAHEGKISVTSEGVDQGSTFQIQLPITNMALKPKSDAAAKKRRMLPACKVLLVDDNVDALQMLAKSLGRRGLEIEPAENGKLAMEQMASFQPVVAVIDIGLPEMNGYEVAKAVRNQSVWNRTLLIALTGYGQESDRRAILASGFDHHLVKPLQFERLIDLIADHVEVEIDRSTS
jgi:two-component system CheB/CheR fusion protein